MSDSSARSGEVGEWLAVDGLVDVRPWSGGVSLTEDPKRDGGIRDPGSPAGYRGIALRSGLTWLTWDRVAKVTYVPLGQLRPVWLLERGDDFAIGTGCSIACRAIDGLRPSELMKYFRSEPLDAPQYQTTLGSYQLKISARRTLGCELTAPTLRAPIAPDAPLPSQASPSPPRSLTVGDPAS